MYYHVGERSRLSHGDYRHHPLVSIFTSALMIPLSLHTLHFILNSCRVHQHLLVFLPSPPSPHASSHRAPYMISFFFHAATEHSDLTHLSCTHEGRSFLLLTCFLSGASRTVSFYPGSRQHGPSDRVLRYTFVNSRSCLRPQLQV